MKFLINMMFSRLNKLDGPIFEGVYTRGGGGGEGTYIWDVNWVRYLGGIYTKETY